MKPAVIDALFAYDPQFADLALRTVGARTTDEFLASVTDSSYEQLIAKMSPASSDLAVPGSGKRLVLRRRRVAKAFNPAAAFQTGKKALVATGNWVKHGTQKRVPAGAGRLALAGTTGAAAVKGSQFIDDTRKQFGYGVPEQPAVYKAMDLDTTTDFDATVPFAKTDTDKRQVFGWASVTHVNGSPVVDRQSDYIDLEEVEKSAYEYVMKSRVGGHQHRRDGDRPFHAADLIESFVITDDKIKAMNLPTTINKGWWVGFKVNDDDTWDKVKRGDVTGFSVHGKGRREVVTGDLLPMETTQQS